MTLQTMTDNTLRICRLAAAPAFAAVVLIATLAGTAMAQDSGADPCAGLDACNIVSGFAVEVAPTGAKAPDDSAPDVETDAAAKDEAAPEKSITETDANESSSDTADSDAAPVKSDGSQPAGNCTTVPAIGASVTCHCEIANLDGTIWGTNLYTTDSTICVAAVHAGALPAISQDGGDTLYAGDVELRGAPGCDGYESSSANGVTSLSYGGSWAASFYFPAVQPGLCNPDDPPAEGTWYCPSQLPDDADALDCHCTPEATEEGGVWGSEIYTADSAICRAALHAGVVGPEGGPVHVVRLDGEESYTGTVRNDVSSSNYESWESSIGFR